MGREDAREREKDGAQRQRWRGVAASCEIMFVDPPTFKRDEMGHVTCEVFHELLERVSV